MLFLLYYPGMSDKTPPPGQPAKRPTGAEADYFSKHTQDLPEIGRLTPGEAAELLEDIAGRPTDYGTTAEAIAATEVRLTRIALARFKLLDAIENGNASPELISEVERLHLEYVKTGELLDHYRTQTDKQN